MTEALETKKCMWIVAGPPGAGKSGLVAKSFGPWVGTSRHIDADDTTGFETGEPLLDAVHKRIIPVSKRLEIAETGGRDFVVETRLVSRKPLSAALRLRRRGWRVVLIYLALPRRDLCHARIRSRVARGGGDVDDDIMERGFTASLDNLPRYIDAAERWLILDGSGRRRPLIARGSYAAAIPEQADALRALLPDYPFLPADAKLEGEAWSGPIVTAFMQLSRWHATLDHLLGVAADMQARRFS